MSDKSGLDSLKNKKSKVLYTKTCGVHPKCTQREI